MAQRYTEYVQARSIEESRKAGADVAPVLHTLLLIINGVRACCTNRHERTQHSIGKLVLDRPQQFIYSALRPLDNLLRQRARLCHLKLAISYTFTLSNSMLV